MTTCMESRRHRIKKLAEIHRGQDPAAAERAAGYGAMHHENVTQMRVYGMAGLLHQRGRERAYPLIARPCPLPEFPEAWSKEGEQFSTMESVDDYFCWLLKARPESRPRVGNPGAMRSNRLNTTLDRHQDETGCEPCRLSPAVVPAAHTWENGKNGQSRQAPALREALPGEMKDLPRVVFPADGNSAAAALYAARGQIWPLMAPGRALPVRRNRQQARQQLVKNGALVLRDAGADEGKLLLIAVGAYQLEETLRAAERPHARGAAHWLVYLFEPGRFRFPRDEREAAPMIGRSPRPLDSGPVTRPRLGLHQSRRHSRRWRHVIRQSPRLGPYSGRGRASFAAPSGRVNFRRGSGGDSPRGRCAHGDAGPGVS